MIIVEFYLDVVMDKIWSTHSVKIVTAKLNAFEIVYWTFNILSILLNMTFGMGRKCGFIDFNFCGF